MLSSSPTTAQHPIPTAAGFREELSGVPGVGGALGAGFSSGESRLVAAAADVLGDPQALLPRVEVEGRLANNHDVAIERDRYGYDVPRCVSSRRVRTRHLDDLRAGTGDAGGEPDGADDEDTEEWVTAHAAVPVYKATSPPLISP